MSIRPCCSWGTGSGIAESLKLIPPKSLARSLLQSPFPHPRPFLAARVFLEPRSRWSQGVRTLTEWPEIRPSFISCKAPDVARPGQTGNSRFLMPQAGHKAAVPSLPFLHLQRLGCSNGSFTPGQPPPGKLGDKFNLEKQPAEWHADQRGTAELD